MPTTIEKQPRESILYDLRFYDEDGETDFRDGEGITAVVASVVVITPHGRVAEVQPLVAGAPLHDGDKTVQVRLAGGTDGEKYNVYALVDTNLGNVMETDGTLYVKEVFK